MNVLYVFHELRPHAGGLVIDLRDLANGLSARGHQVRIATLASPQAPVLLDDFAESVALHQFRPGPPERLRRRVGLVSGVGRCLRRQSFGVVHVFSCLPVYLNFAAMLAARRTGSAVVWTPMIHPSRRDLWSTFHPMRLFDHVAPRAARWVDAVVAATEAEAEEFRRLGCRRVELIPPGVAGGRPVPEEEARRFREDLGLGDGLVVLTVAARDEPRKGLAFGLEVFRCLRRRLPDVSLVLVGRNQQVKTGSPAEGVRAIGRLSDADLARALRAANVVFVPSRYEAFSRVVIEAWQQSTPVVATQGVALAPTIQGVGGQVIRFGDVEQAAESLRLLLLDPERVRRYGEGGRGLVEERFLLSTVVARMLALYESLVSA